MTQAVHVMTLVENSVHRADLVAEHGLSFWIETASARILFDTGQGHALFHNAPRQGIDLRRTTAIALSHGHFDHTGGLQQALNHARQAQVFFHPDAFAKKWSGNGSVHEVGLPHISRRTVEKRATEAVETLEPTAVASGIYLTGPVPRLTDFEDVGGRFYLDDQAEKDDPLYDDQSLYFDTPDGVVVVFGCAHAGVINTLKHIQEITDGRPIHTVMGGMHLLNADDDRIERTIDFLRELDVKQIGPAHCTGRKATQAIWQALGDRCFGCHVGMLRRYELA